MLSRQSHTAYYRAAADDGVSKHVGWRPPRLVASLSCYHILLPNVNPSVPVLSCAFPLLTHGSCRWCKHNIPPPPGCCAYVSACPRSLQPKPSAASSARKRRRSHDEAAASGSDDENEAGGDEAPGSEEAEPAEDSTDEEAAEAAVLQKLKDVCKWAADLNTAAVAKDEWTDPVI